MAIDFNRPETLEQAGIWDKLNPSTPNLNPYRRSDVVTPLNARGAVPDVSQFLMPKQGPNSQLLPTGQLQAGAPGTKGQIRLRMPDNTESIFTGLTPDLDAALRAGGRLLRPDNTLASLREFNGGWLADDKPLNAWLGEDLTPDQIAALPQQQPQQPGAPNPLAPQQPNPFAPLDTSGGTNDILNQLLQRVLELQNMDKGLSPEAKSAMTTQALEGVKRDYDNIRSSLATKLRRDNPSGLPQGGELLRGYGPLMASEAGDRSGRLLEIALADEQAKRENRSFGLQTLSLAGQLAGQRGQLDLATMDMETRTRLAQMGIDSNEKLAKLDSDLRRELSTQGIDANMALAQLDANTRMKLMEMQIAGDKVGLRIAGSILSSAIANPKLMDSAIGWISGALGIGKKTAEKGVESAGDIGSVTGFGDKLKSFAKNPWTIGIAAAIGAGFLLYKKFGTDHLRADELVTKFENPFAEEVIFPMHREFFNAAKQGKMTEEQANAARSEFVAGWEEYVRQIKAWAGNDGSKNKVVEQSINNLWPTVKRMADDMDTVIANGGYDYAMEAA